ncbi:MAG: hypothetical protein QOD99_1957, partial [Chthoniobacter sp.]|nr:hypothetical protein [Chthoniobacter sp.]
AILATSLVMTLAVLAPEFWPAFHPKNLPLRLDRAPIAAYRFVERNLARVMCEGETPLPVSAEADPREPEKFWQ